MTRAILTLDDMPPVDGRAETGGDFIRFRAGADFDADRLAPLHRGRIEIEGRAEDVMVKSVMPAAPDSDGGQELTLQRFQPSVV